MAPSMKIVYRVGVGKLLENQFAGGAQYSVAGDFVRIARAKRAKLRLGKKKKASAC